MVLGPSCSSPKYELNSGYMSYQHGSFEATSWNTEHRYKFISIISIINKPTGEEASIRERGKYQNDQKWAASQILEWLDVHIYN